MAKTPSSRRWLDRHVSDPYVKRSRVDGYRSRAAYKLLEIQARDRLLAPGMQVLDLGAAPGSWSQVAARLVGDKGQVIALDLLSVEPLPGVTILQGDFREDAVLERLLAALDDRPLDLVMSDMAPNMTGTAVTDQSRMMYLLELTLQLARERLRPGGALLVKAFQGSGFDAYLRQLRADFRQVASRKPKSSRARSRELYLVAKGLREPTPRSS